MTDVICGAVVLVYAFSGWSRGFWSELVALLGLVAATTAATLLHPHLGALLVQLTPLQPLLAYPVAVPAIFVTVLILFAIPARSLRKRRRAGEGSAFDLPGRLAGALLGGARGAALVMVVIWALLFAGRILPGRAPDVRSSVAGQLAAPHAGPAVGLLTRQITGSPTVAASAESLVAQPQQTVRALGSLAQNRRLRALARDDKLVQSLRKSATVDPAEHPGLRALCRDRAFVRDARQLGLLQGDPTALSPAEVQRQLTTKLGPLARELLALAEDEQLRIMLQDPQLSARLQTADNPLALLNDPKVNAVATRVLGRLHRAAAGLPEQLPEE